MMTDNMQLECIEIEPELAAARSVIWLHGLGADGNDFVPLVPALHLPNKLAIRFIFPHAPIMPVTINNGYEMRAWFDIPALSVDGLSRKIDIKPAMQLVQNLIAQEISRGIKSENIILAGFSQGAVMALLTGLSYPKKLAGIMALSGCLPGGQEGLNSVSEANKHIPIFIAHGTEDPMVPFELGKNAYELLKQAGFPIAWHAYPMPHTVCPEEVDAIRTWLLKVYN